MKQRRGFTVWHGTRGRGRNHVNRYIPNPEKVPSATPFWTAARNPPAGKKGVSAPDKRCQHAPKKVSDPTPDTVVVTDPVYLRTETASLRSAPFRVNGADVDLCQDKNDDSFLARIERLLPNYQGKLRHAQMLTVIRWRDRTEEIFESYDAHKGDPTGGRAYRLLGELQWIIDQNGGEP